jgi:pyruvate-ferredoxin/flavodoxin oxidoreductase
MHPLFVHDPRRGQTLHDWFSLDGNPDIGSTWTTSTLQYVDDDGQLQLLTTPLTPAEFALGEVRFKKQFARLSPDDEAVGVPIHEYVELPVAQRAGRIPYVFATDDERHLIKVACSNDIVALVEDRRRYWQTLQYLSGVHEAQLTALHRSDLDELRAMYESATEQREQSLDDIARAMSELATSSRAPAGAAPPVPAAASSTLQPAAAGGGSAVAVVDAPVYLDPADIPLCNDCGTCYQEFPQFFEKTTMIIDGEARQVAQMIPGAVETVEVTPEIAARIARVRKTCDAEIIR